MSYRVISMRGGNYGRKSEDIEFEEAAQMVEEGLECMRELAEDMKEQYGMRRGSYGSRGGYGMRGRYGDREMWDEMDDMMNERRMRDSRGRFR